ncbi:MAG: hypothetical protein V4505_25905 [Pseudomonadota bacterium]
MPRPLPPSATSAHRTGALTAARAALMGLAALLLAGCAAPVAPTHGVVPTTEPSAQELAQTTSDRLATLAMRANLDSLYLLMDKLYARNPAQWRKTGAASAQAAAFRVRDAVEHHAPWPDLQGKRDIDAMAWALTPQFRGDRVGALVYATADMLITAHGGRTEFFITDQIDPQYIYNCARNIEILVWMLAHRHDPASGGLLLLADEIGDGGRNLSFEREFGKVIGRLDLLATFTTERHRRAVIGYFQGYLAVELLRFLPVR